MIFKPFIVSFITNYRWLILKMNIILFLSEYLLAGQTMCSSAACWWNLLNLVRAENDIFRATMSKNIRKTTTNSEFGQKIGMQICFCTASRLCEFLILPFLAIDLRIFHTDSVFNRAIAAEFICFSYQKFSALFFRPLHL